ncbi:MAG: hypothetical protein ACK4ND_08755 [Cytophagaceae bacterium]
MNQKRIVDTALKIMGIYFLAMGLLNLSDMLMVLTTIYNDPYSEYESGYVSQLYRGYGIKTLAYLSLFVAFTLFSHRIVKFLKLNETETQSIPLPPKKQLIEIAFIIAGLLTLANSMPYIATDLIEKVYFFRDPEINFWNNRRTDFIFSCIKMVVGFLFIAYAATLSKIITKTSVPSKSLEEIN